MTHLTTVFSVTGDEPGTAPARTKAASRTAPRGA